MCFIHAFHEIEKLSITHIKNKNTTLKMALEVSGEMRRLMKSWGS